MATLILILGGVLRDLPFAYHPANQQDFYYG